jgi:hypothetical protein
MRKLVSGASGICSSIFKFLRPSLKKNGGIAAKTIIQN